MRVVIESAFPVMILGSKVMADQIMNISYFVRSFDVIRCIRKSNSSKPFHELWDVIETPTDS